MLPEPFLSLLLTGAKDKDNYFLHFAGENMGVCSGTAKGIWNLISQNDFDTTVNLKDTLDTSTKLNESMKTKINGIWHISYKNDSHYLIILKINDRYYLLQSWETTFTLLWWLKDTMGKILSTRRYSEFGYIDHNKFLIDLEIYRDKASSAYNTPEELWSDFYKYTKEIFKKDLTFDDIYSIKYSHFKSDMVGGFKGKSNKKRKYNKESKSKRKKIKIKKKKTKRKTKRRTKRTTKRTTKLPLIFVINLDRDKKKWEKYKDDNRFIRFTACDGMKTGKSNPYYKKLKIMWNASDKKRKCTAGILNSHMTLLHQIVNKKLNKVLVIEDDAIIDFKKLKSINLNHLPQDSIIYFGGSLTPPTSFKDKSFNYKKTIQSFKRGINKINSKKYRILGGHGYYFPTWKIAENLLTILNKKEKLKPLDTEMTYLQRKGIIKYFYYPAISYLHMPDAKKGVHSNYIVRNMKYYGGKNKVT